MVSILRSFKKIMLEHDENLSTIPKSGGIRLFEDVGLLIISMTASLTKTSNHHQCWVIRYTLLHTQGAKWVRQERVA